MFAPKYRRKTFYGGRRLEIGAILRKLCEWKGMNIIEAEVCGSHVYVVGDIAQIFRFEYDEIFERKSSLLTYDKWRDMKYR